MKGRRATNRDVSETLGVSFGSVQSIRTHKLGKGGGTVGSSNADGRSEKSSSGHFP